MSDPKRQHWVPQFYLKHFAIPETIGTKNEQVWALSRQKGAPLDPIRPSTECVAVQKFLYSPLGPDGKRDFALEKKLTGIEGLMASVWSDFADPSVKLTTSSQKGMALFLATLYLRHPRQRESLKKRHQRMVDQISADFERHSEETELNYDLGNQSFNISVDEFTELKNLTDNDHHLTFVEHIEATAIPLAERLLKKRWTFIVADNPAFITCDNPMSLRGPNHAGEPVSFGASGMSVEFAISPHVLLHLSDGEGLALAPLKKSPYSTDRPWAAFNFEMWTNASRFMFSPRDPVAVIREIMEFVDFCEAHPDGPKELK